MTVRRLPLNAPSTWLATLAALAFLALGLRALLAPMGAAASFGVPLDGGSGLAFVRAFGARNVGLSLGTLALITLDVPSGVAALFFAGAVIAGLDFSIVALHEGALHAVKHLGYVALLLGFAFWFARRR